MGEQEAGAAPYGFAAETMRQQNQSAVSARSQTLVEIRFAGAVESPGDAAGENPSAADWHNPVETEGPETAAAGTGAAVGAAETEAVGGTQCGGETGTTGTWWSDEETQLYQSAIYYITIECSNCRLCASRCMRDAARLASSTKSSPLLSAPLWHRPAARAMACNLTWVRDSL